MREIKVSEEILRQLIINQLVYNTDLSNTEIYKVADNIIKKI